MLYENKINNDIILISKIIARNSADGGRRADQ
jgi:hypothetical protein